MTELKRFCSVCILEPAKESVTYAQHVFVFTGLLGDRSVHNELRRIVGRAFELFVEDEPESERRIDLQVYVALDGDLSIVRVRSFSGCAYDISRTAVLCYVPTFEVLRIALRSVAHIDGRGSLLCAGGNQDGGGSERNAGLFFVFRIEQLLAKVSDRERTHDERIVNDLALAEVRSADRGSCCVTNIIDGQRLVLGFEDRL